MIGATKDVDIDTSETSSYQSSSDDEAMKENTKSKQSKQK
jgi:hypothetical protein